jgi:hypothetical protein
VIESHSIDPVELASSAAIRTIGGEEIVPSEDGLRVAGWTGTAWTNVPSRQQYELLVDLRSAPTGYEF